MTGDAFLDCHIINICNREIKYQLMSASVQLSYQRLEQYPRLKGGIIFGATLIHIYVCVCVFVFVDGWIGI